MGWRQEQQRQAWANWINAEQWDVFGTLNFASLHHIGQADRDDVCGKMWRSYFGAIDRALYGQQRKRQSRFDRVVLGECPIFCVTSVWSMLPERSKDDDNFQGTAGRTSEGLRAA
jgi:hypothetical protein